VFARRLTAAGQLLGIDVADALIIGQDTVVSLKELGLL
jgi:DNA repair protein RadC